MKKGVEKIKILIVTTGYPDEFNNLNRIFIKEQIEALEKRYQNLEFEVLSISGTLRRFFKEKHWKSISKIKVVNGIKIYNFKYLDYTRYFGIDKNIKYYEKKIDEILKKFLKNKEYDLIHAHFSYSAGYYANYISEKLAIPYIITEHASFFSEQIKNKNKYIVKALNESNYNIAVGDELYKKVENVKKENLLKITNFINLEKFKNSRKNKEKNKKIKILNISLNNGKDLKGIKNLMLALQKLKKQQDFELLLIGDAPNRKFYENYSKELGIEENINFLWRVSNDEIPKYINISDFLVISSKVETFCVAGIEAMALGKPVLSTKCGGPEDYIKEFNGILIENKSVDALYKGMIEIVDKLNNYSSEKIKNYVVEEYYKKPMKLYYELYKKVVIEKRVKDE